MTQIVLVMFAVVGIRVCEYQPAMMHAKSIVADGRFVSAGTDAR